MICKKCGKDFVPDNKRQVYCNFGFEYTCIYCGKIFIKKCNGRNYKTCSPRCRALSSLEHQRKNHDGKLAWNTNKQKQTMIKKYGVEVPCKNKEIKQKAIEIQKLKNDGKLAWNTDKQKQTMIKKYGVETKLGTKECILRWKEWLKNNPSGAFQNNHQKTLEKLKMTNLEKYGVEYQILTRENKEKNGHTISQTNRRWAKFLSAELEVDNFDLLLNDIYIEINPWYTHNSTVGTIWSDKPLEKDCHLKKTNKAKELGRRCVHVWDWDDENKILNLFQKKEKIYARKCQIKEIPSSLSKEFLNKYHLQNYVSSKIRYGLFYNGELVSVMTFGKPRYNKNYDYELLRYCSSKNIVGGSKKLFNHFIKEHNNCSIISYCDMSKFDGKVYEKLGFKLLKKTNPSRHFWRQKRRLHFTDNFVRQHGADRLIGTNYGKGTDNVSILIENGFVEIYDCGQMVFVYNK